MRDELDRNHSEAQALRDVVDPASLNSALIELLSKGHLVPIEEVFSHNKHLTLVLNPAFTLFLIGRWHRPPLK